MTGAGCTDCIAARISTSVDNHNWIISPIMPALYRFDKASEKRQPRRFGEDTARADGLNDSHR